MKQHPVVSHDEWTRARVAFLKKEKEFSRARDELARARRELPWEKVEKAYAFDTPAGRKSLADLFNGRAQLVVYHFMFAPDWKEGCAHCSFWADHFPRPDHLAQKDTVFVAISRAPLDRIEQMKQRMGWTFTWVSSGESDFNYDFQASFRPDQRKNGAIYNYVPGEKGSDREGVSVFYKGSDGAIYHTYSSYARGIDLLNTTYNVLDLTPLGRNEDPEATQEWVKHRDKYPHA